MRPIAEILADCARVNRELDLEQDPRYTRGTIQGPDQQVSHNPSLGYRRSRDGLSETPCSEAICGITAMISRITRRRLVRLGCGKLSCRRCGPGLKLKRVQHYLEVIGDTPVTAVTIARTAWPRLRSRLASRPSTKTKPARPAVPYLRFDQPDGTYLVLHASTAEPVASLNATLTGAFARLPAGGRVSSSRVWSLAAAAEQSEWRLEGVSHASLAEAIRIARELDLYEGPLFDSTDAHVLRTIDSRFTRTAYRVFCERIALHLPDHHRPRARPEPEQTEMAA